MKTIQKNLVTVLSVLLVTSISAFAGPGHSHEKKEAGPNGGRIITTVTPHAEFLVTPDRKVKITFLGEDGKVVPPSDQVVTVTTGERSAPVKLVFSKQGDSLISDGVIPEGSMFPTVIQIKATPDSETATARFNLNMANCPGCQKPEYACTCAH